GIGSGRRVDRRKSRNSGKNSAGRRNHNWTDGDCMAPSPDLVITRTFLSEDRMLNRCFAAFAVAVALMLCVSSTTRADDKAADFSGNWKWSAQMRNNTVDFTATLKQDGDKVTGTIKT